MHSTYHSMLFYTWKLHLFTNSISLHLNSIATLPVKSQLLASLRVKFIIREREQLFVLNRSQKFLATHTDKVPNYSIHRYLIGRRASSSKDMTM